MLTSIRWSRPLPGRTTKSGGSKVEPGRVEAGLEARSVKARLTPVVDVIVALGTCLVLGYGARLALAGN